jgi:hypothetical protein
MTDNHLIDGEIAYPIYRITAHWHEDITPDASSAPDPWTEDLPIGRIWNSTGWSPMFKVEQTERQLHKYLIDWWDKSKQDSDTWGKRNPSTPILSIAFVEYETWVLTWFSHRTFDVGQSDEEALRSFEKFVQRKQALIREKGTAAYCLMGAEDHWRWKGLDEKQNRVDPPCRCAGCKANGFIAICH